MKSIVVSVVMPCFNSEDYIARAVESVLSQTYKAWELIVVDDCSSDSTRDIVHKYSERYPNQITIVANDKNRGAAVSRNRGLEKVKGRYIAFLDSDDFWLPTKLEKQIKFMEAKNAPVSFTSYSTIADGSAKGSNVIHAVPIVDYSGYLKNTIIGMSTAVVDTAMTGTIRFENIRTRQDTLLWITLLKKGLKAHGLAEVLSFYSARSGSISANKIKAARRVWWLYYHHEKLGLFTSAYFFTSYALNAIRKRLI